MDTTKKILSVLAASMAALGAFLLLRRRRIEDITNELPRRSRWPSRDLRGVTDITVHHSATMAGGPFAFASFHVRRKGWPGIGYHFVIDRDGKIFQTNELTAASWHNGYNNRAAVGVCLVGDFTKSAPTPDQLAAVEWLTKYLRRKVPSIGRLAGHKELPGASTACPGSFPVNWLRGVSGLRPVSGAVALASWAGFSGPVSGLPVYDLTKADN